MPVAILFVDKSRGFPLFEEGAHAFLLIGGLEAGAEKLFFKGYGFFNGQIQAFGISSSCG